MIENLKIWKEDLEPLVDGRFKYVLQRHARGKSVHLDLRMVVPEKSHLIGLTLDLGDPKKEKAFLTNPTDVQVLTQVKTRQPLPWLSAKGDVPPGGIGATKYKSAEFEILDRGYVEYGAMKYSEGFYEFFFHSSKGLKGIMNGRYITRKLKLPADPDDPKSEKIERLLFWKPKDQKPYIETHPEYEKGEMRMSTSEIVLGVNLSADSYFDDDGALHFSGTALEEGLWTDANSNAWFWPAEAIRNSAKSFEGVDVLCEHKGLPIGKILKTEKTDRGFRVSDGIITSKRIISLIVSNEKRGLSITAMFKGDPVRKIVNEIYNPKEISLVKNPACKICVLDDVENYEKNSGDIMTENENVLKEKEYESYPEPDCDKFKTEKDKYQACKTFAEAVKVFRKAQDEWHKIFVEDESKMSTEIVEEAPETVEETVTASAEPETEVEPEVEETVTASAEPEVEKIVTTSTEVVDKTASLKSEVAELTGKLDEAEIQLASAKAEISVIGSELQILKDEKRETLVSSVMSADPNADTEMITQMSDGQLEAYKETIIRLSTPTVGAQKKSIKAEEQVVEMSAKEATEKAGFEVDNVIKYLRMKQ